jgi:hypothetical protein
MMPFLNLQLYDEDEYAITLHTPTDIISRLFSVKTNIGVVVELLQ